jgi:hypothetical protein
MKHVKRHLLAIFIVTHFYKLLNFAPIHRPRPSSSFLFASVFSKSPYMPNFLYANIYQRPYMPWILMGSFRFFGFPLTHRIYSFYFFFSLTPISIEVLIWISFFIDLSFYRSQIFISETVFSVHEMKICRFLWILAEATRFQF